MNKTLYQKNTSGKVKVWSIKVTDNGNDSTIHIEAGQLGGKLIPTDTVISEGKNIGKANETTHHTQALAEAQSKIEEKLRKGYVEDVTKVQSSSVLGSGIPQPMLAHKYDPIKKQSGSKNLKDIGVEGKIVYAQRKKDGNRCLIHVTKSEATMWTRKGDPFIPMPHIIDSVAASFAKIYDYVNKKYGVTEYWLDGELYTKAFSFNKMNGLAKKETRTADDLQDILKIKYHIYDVILDAGYETRRKIINYFKSPTVHVEESYEVEATEKNLREYLEKFLAEGEEGLMIRVAGKGYEHKRSWSLCKYKTFEDAEFEVTGFEESVKGGMVGAVIVRLDKVCTDRDGKPIHTFKAGLSMSHEECTEIWKNKDKYIGKKMTIEFFERSEYGVPRFPKAKAFRDDN